MDWSNFEEQIEVFKTSRVVQLGLGKNLNDFRKNKTFCDVIFDFGDFEIYAHKNVLAAQNPFFRSKFENDNSPIKHRINVTIRNRDIFESFVKFFYIGSIIVNSNNVYILTELAAEYVCDEILEICSKYLHKNIRNDNCITIKNLADRVNLLELSEISKHYILDNYNTLIRNSNICKISLPEIQALLSVKSLANRSLVNIICTWVRVNGDKNYLHRLFKCLNWKEVNEKRLDSIFLSNIYLEDNEDIFALLNAVSNQRSLSDKYLDMLKFSRNEFEKVNIVVNPLDVENENIIIENDHNDEKVNDVEKIPSTNNNEINTSSDIKNNDGLKQEIIIVQEDNKTTIPIVKLNSRMQPSRKKKNAKTNGKKYQCILCEYKSHSPIRIEHHYKTTHKNNNDGIVKFNCDLCQFNTENSREFYSHMKKHINGPPYKCDEKDCSFETDTIYKVLEHKKLHLDIRPFVCEICNAKFKQKSNFHSHLILHSGVKDFVCDECGKRFAAKNTLRQHFAVHSSSKKFLCDQCPFSTGYRSHLTSHIRTHDKNSMFYCTYNNCNYKATKLCILNSHLKKHTGKRDFICSTCGKAFMERSHLVRHEKIHSGNKPYKCNHCDYASIRRDKLRIHNEKHQKSPNYEKKSKNINTLNTKEMHVNLTLFNTNMPAILEQTTKLNNEVNTIIS